MGLIITEGTQVPQEMKAVVLEKPKTLTVKKIPVWPIERYGDSDFVLLKVRSCGICGSDLRYFEGENPWAQHTLGRHINNPPNIVLGHEFSGDVVAVLDERNKHLLGKRVVSICFKICGRCIYCKTDREHLCPNTIHMGHGQGWGKQEYYPGAYAEYVPSWGRNCFEIPEGVTYDEAAMIDILGVCTRVAHQGNIKEGFPVLIIGCGPAGNGISQIARILGASKIIVTGRSKITLDLARKQDFDRVIDIKDKDNDQIKDIVLKETNSYGCGTVIDTVGTEATFHLGLSVLDKGGAYVSMAVHNKVLQFNNMDIGSEKSIVTSCNTKLSEYPTTLSWLGNKRINVDSWITNVSLEEVPETFEKLKDKKMGRQYFKVVINP